MLIEFDTMDVAGAADDMMHAAQHLAGVGKNNYSDPAVWQSTDPAVIICRECYLFLSDALDWAYSLQGLSR